MRAPQTSGRGPPLLGKNEGKNDDESCKRRVRQQSERHATRGGAERTHIRII
jgi:hypothetical protein